MIKGVFNNVKNDLSLSLLIGKQNSQTVDQDDQKTADKEGKWNRIGSYELVEDVEACLLLECLGNSHKIARFHNEKDPLLLLNSRLSYKRLKVKKTRDDYYNIIFL